MCQLRHINELERENSWISDKFQFSIRKFRYYRRRLLQFFNSAGRSHAISIKNSETFQPGDIVRVRSEAEIKQTLNRLRKTRGCTFQVGMYECCDKKYRVFKKVDYFFDEARQKMCKCNDIYLLEGSYCSGVTAYLRPCKRNCFYFWQASWLEKV